MASGRRGAVNGPMLTLLQAGAIGGLADGALLERFAAGGDEGAEHAFAALVDRHGPMVLRTCRAILRDGHDAEDAFQATFLVLARKAGTLRSRGSLGPWLHEVAHRVASCARTASARRRAHERRAAEMSPTVADDGPWEDVGPALHEEIRRLPDRYRAAVVLCGLEGQTQQQAARQLGWPLGTLQSRLFRGRERLKGRLIRRGLAPSAGFLAVLATVEVARGAVPSSLAEPTTRAAARFAAGGTAIGVEATVLTLTNRTLRSMTMTKFKMAAAGLLSAGVLAAGGLAALQRTLADEPKRVEPPEAGAIALAEEVPIVRKFEHGEQIMGVAFSPDGKTLASAGNGNGAKVKLWSTRTGELSRTMEGAWVGWRSVAFSPDGKRVVAVGNGRMPAKYGGGEAFRCWDAGSGEPIWTAPAVEPQAEFFSVAFSPDGKTLAVGGRSGALLVGFRAKIGVLRLHDPRTGELLRSIPGLDDIWALAFSPDGKTLAVGANTDGQVSLFDTETWELSRSFLVGRPTSLAFSPDGRTLAVGKMGANPSGIVALLDLDGKAELRAFAPQPEIVLSVAFSPDGEHLATGGYDKTARVYDLKTGSLERSRTTPNWANTVAFSPDGKFLAIGTSPDCLLWTWGADPAPADPARK